MPEAWHLQAHELPGSWISCLPTTLTNGKYSVTACSTGQCSLIYSARNDPQGIFKSFLRDFGEVLYLKVKQSRDPPMGTEHLLYSRLGFENTQPDPCSIVSTNRLNKAIESPWISLRSRCRSQNLVNCFFWCSGLNIFDSLWCYPTFIVRTRVSFKLWAQPLRHLISIRRGRMEANVQPLSASPSSEGSVPNTSRVKFARLSLTQSYEKEMMPYAAPQ